MNIGLNPCLFTISLILFLFIFYENAIKNNFEHHDPNITFLCHVPVLSLLLISSVSLADRHLLCPQFTHLKSQNTKLNYLSRGTNWRPREEKRAQGVASALDSYFYFLYQSIFYFVLTCSICYGSNAVFVWNIWNYILSWV